MSKSKIKAISSAIRPRQQPQPEITQAKIPKLPNEILGLILNILHSEGDFKTLTSAARINKNMYDIVIPKIYQTVVVNERNRDKIGYGHGDSTSNLERASNNESLTRKDLATTFTRKLVFDSQPETAIPKSYQAVQEVIFGSTCMSIAIHLHGPQIEKHIQAKRVASLFANCLTAVASTGSSASVIHVKMYMAPRIDYDILRAELTCLQTTIPIAYGFFDVPIDWMTSSLQLAYSMRAVVHFDKASVDPQDVVAQHLADQISEMLMDGILTALASQAYLCDVPQLVLRPDEFETAENVDETAIIKICGLIDNDFWPVGIATPTERLEFLKSKVKLVGPGFRPTLPHPATTQSTTDNVDPSTSLNTSLQAPNI